MTPIDYEKLFEHANETLLKTPPTTWETAIKDLDEALRGETSADLELVGQGLVLLKGGASTSRGRWV